MTFKEAQEQMMKGLACKRTSLDVKQDIYFYRPSDTIPIRVVKNIQSLPTHVREVLDHLTTLLNKESIIFDGYFCSYTPLTGVLNNNFFFTDKDRKASDWEVIII